MVANLLQYRAKVNKTVTSVVRYEDWDFHWGVDFVGDNYVDEHPLKAQTQRNRGAGTVISIA